MPMMQMMTQMMASGNIDVSNINLNGPIPGGSNPSGKGGGGKSGGNQSAPYNSAPEKPWKSKRTDGFGYDDKPENKEWYDNWRQTSGWIDFSKQPKQSKAPSAPEPEGDLSGWSSIKNTPLPTIVGISVAATSKLVVQGYPTDVAAMEYSKDIAIFSDAHHILQDFFTAAVNDVVAFDHDPECNVYPEVFQAWKAAGQEDNTPTVATCPSLGQWAVGFGGKTNANRAAKLSLALTVAAVSDPQKLKSVVSHYPQFGQLCQIAGIEVPGGVPMPPPPAIGDQLALPGQPPSVEQMAMQQLQQQMPPGMAQQQQPQLMGMPQQQIMPGQAMMGMQPAPPPPQMPGMMQPPAMPPMQPGMDPAIAAAAAQAAAQLAAQNPHLQAQMQAQQAGMMR